CRRCPCASPASPCAFPSATSAVSSCPYSLSLPHIPVGQPTPVWPVESSPKRYVLRHARTRFRDTTEDKRMNGGGAGGEGSRAGLPARLRLERLAPAPWRGE